MPPQRFCIPAYSIPSLAVNGTSARFPVRRIYGVGRNYASHGADTAHAGAAAAIPGFTLKPTDVVLPGGGALPYPPATRQLEPEIEMVVAIGKGGRDITRGAALEHVFGYAVGFDMIRRDLLAECIRNHHAWDIPRSFAGAAPVSAISPAAAIGHPGRGAIWIDVNGERRQHGDLSDMTWNVAEIVARLSSYCALVAGDIIFTGTPKGPAPVLRGDRLHGHIDGVSDLHATIV